MQAQLQDGVDPVAGLFFQLLQGVGVPGVEDQRFFTNGVGADAQGETDVRVMEIIRGNDGDIVDTLRFFLAAQLFHVAVEAFELGEKGAVREIAVQNSNGI